LNIKVAEYFRKFSYSLIANLVSMFVSVLVVLLIPKIIGVVEYGYWQLYVFYSGYVGFLHFGWNDGIYLRYGGYDYKDLEKKNFFSQYYLLLFFQIFIAAFAILSFKYLNFDPNKYFVIQMTALSMVIVNVRYMLLYIFQTTSRFKEYSMVIIIDRLSYLTIIIFLILIEINEYKLMIFVDLFSKLIALLYSMYYCKEIVFRKVSDFYIDLVDIKLNISVGIKLMFANVASLLIIGVIKFGIEQFWDVGTFGKVSLTLNISNLLMLFINAIGIIMFPILKRTNTEKLNLIYITMRDLLMAILLGVLIVYYPLKSILSIWLPEYAEALKYMALVFPMSLYEGKMVLLINTYLKALRKEALILKINLVTLILSVAITITNTLILGNLDFTIASIVILLALRSILAEYFLSKHLKISLSTDIMLELVMTLIFVFSGWLLDSWFSVLIYMLAYIVYLFIKRKSIRITMLNVRSIINT
jgi:O-antigen/teichoic acid export membrane protein